MKKTTIWILWIGLMSTTLAFGQKPDSGQQVKESSKLKTEICLPVSAILPASTQVVTLSPESTTRHSGIRQIPANQLHDDSSYQLKSLDNNNKTQATKTKVSAEDIPNKLQ